MMDGRVKTLHPAVHGGLLAVRDNPEHQAALAAHGIGAIDLLVVNLYPFEATIAAQKPARRLRREHRCRRPGDDPRRGQEPRGRGGGHRCRRLSGVLAALESGDGAIGVGLRRSLAQKAFARTASYDSAIADWMAGRSDQTGPAPFRTSAAASDRGCATARTRTSRRPSTGRPVFCARASPPPASSRARNSPITTSTTPTPLTRRWPSSTRPARRRWRSSSTPTLRRGRGREPARRLRAGARLRPDLGLRRHRRPQPDAGW